MACSSMDVEGKRIRVCKLREPREMVAEAADEVRRTLTMASPPDRSNQITYANSMPAGPVLTSKRHTTQTCPPPSMFRSAVATSQPRSSQLTYPTESSGMKTHKSAPNESDKNTGWGPIENMTVATLEYVHSKQSVPREDQAFMELATWLSSHAQPRPGLITADVSSNEGTCSPGSPRQGQETTSGQADVTYYTRLAEQLLTLHKSTLAALIQEPPKHDMSAYWARQLWNSIPQPQGRPAAREQAEQLTMALDMALADLMSRHGLSMATTQGSHVGGEAAPPKTQHRNWSSQDQEGLGTRELSWEDEKPVWQHMETELERQVGVHCHEHATLLRRALQRRDEREEEQQHVAEQLRERAVASAEAAAKSEQRAAEALADAEHAGQQRRNAEVEVEILRTRVRDMQAKTDEMILKYRRGRWDVIEAQVRLRETRMQAQMSEWMQQTRSELRAELEEQYQQTVQESAQEGAGGAVSAQQPDLV